MQSQKPFEGTPEVRLGLGPTIRCEQYTRPILGMKCNLPMRSVLKRNNRWEYFRIYRCPLGHQIQAIDQIAGKEKPLEFNFPKLR